MSHRYFSQSALSENDALLIALFFATIIHGLILLGINFTMPTPRKLDKQIEITLASSPVKQPPKKANYLAQKNQLAAGQKAEKPVPPKQQIPARQHRKPEPLKQNNPVQAKKPVLSNQKLITRRQASRKINIHDQPQQHPQKKRPKLSADMLQQQIAQLGTKIRQTRSSSTKTKIKFINSVNAHQYVAAQYLKDWETKVEKVGNLNYPEVAKKRGFIGTLVTDVGINPDGTVYSIRITRSSGNPALDQAAKRIIKLSAPFAALPKTLLEELDVLVITRVWKFSDESGITH